MSWVHKHRWFATKVDNLEKKKRVADEWVGDGEISVVHFVCGNDMSHIKTIEVEGRWTLAEIADFKMNQMKK